MKKLTLHFLNGEKETVLYDENTVGPFGDDWGTPGWITEWANRNGCISVGNNGVLCGLNGGSGPVVYPMSSIKRMEFEYRDGMVPPGGRDGG